MTQLFVTPDLILARGICDRPNPEVTREEVIAAFAGRGRATAAEVAEAPIPALHRLFVLLHPMALSGVELMACALGFAKGAFEKHEPVLCPIFCTRVIVSIAAM